MLNKDWEMLARASKMLNGFVLMGASPIVPRKRVCLD